MAQIYYERNAARKIRPGALPQAPAPVKRGPQRQPSASPASLRLASKRRVALVLIAILFMLAWIVPSLIADASAEMRAAALIKSEKRTEEAMRDNIRLKNEVERAIPAEEAYDIAIGEYGMIRSEDDPVILPEEGE